jgi:hypothetical protein
MTYKTVEKILASGGMQLYKTFHAISGTSRSYRDDEGRSASIFTHDSRPVQQRDKNPKSEKCPHCGQTPPESHEAWMDRKGGRHEIILHYNDQNGEHQNVKFISKTLPTSEELKELWDKNKKEGYQAKPIGY